MLEREETVPRATARWGPTLLLALAFALLVSIRLDQPGFFDNEGRYAEVAREMLLSEDFVTPTMNFSLFLNKPPLMFWLVASAFALNGQDERARLVSVLAATLSIVLTCRLGARLFGAGTGLLAGVFLATMLGFVIEARTLRPDSLIICSVLAALCCWRVAEDAPERRRRAWLALGYAALALGFMAKGAVPVAVAAVPVVLCTVRDHGWRGLARLHPLLGLAVFVLVAAPWHLIAAWRHPGFAWDYVVNQHLLFFLHRKPTRDSEGDPLVFFWGAFLGRALPWIALVPLLAREGLRGLRRGSSEPERASAFVWAWLGGVLGLFSLTGSRLEHYSLPALPAVALLAARGWQRLRVGELGSAAWRWIGAVAAGAVAAGVVGAGWGRELLGRIYWIGDAPGLLSLVPLAGAVVGLGGLFLAWSVLRRSPRAVAAALVAIAVPLSAVVMRALAEAEPIFSWRPLARTIVARVPASFDVVFEAPIEYQQVGGLAFYTGRRIALLEPPHFVPPAYLEPYDETMFLSRGDFERRWRDAAPLALVSDPHLRRETPDGVVPGQFHVLDRSGDRWLLTNLPPDGAGPAG